MIKIIQEPLRWKRMVAYGSRWSGGSLLWKTELIMAKYIQQQIDFEKIIHVRENSVLNEKHLNENRYHFTGQAAVVLSWIQKGIFVTAEFAHANKISHLARRVGDIGEFGGVDVDREYVLNNGKQTRFLAYFLPENRQKFIQQGRILKRDRWWYSENYTPIEIINQIKNNNQS